MKHRVLIHGGIAAAWAVLTLPAWLWWSDSVLFVIAASIFANVYAAVSALEAADDSKVMARLAELEEKLDRALDLDS